MPFFWLSCRTPSAIVVAAAAFAAGWLLPEKPMQAIALVMVPLVAVGVVHVIVDGDFDSLGLLLVGVIGVAVIGSALAHAGAWVALRRQA